MVNFALALRITATGGPMIEDYVQMLARLLELAGVAKDKAQGQVTINTDTATIMALPGDSPQAHTAANAATTNTANKNGLAMRSASAANRGLCNEAVCIKLTIAA